MPASRRSNAAAGRTAIVLTTLTALSLLLLSAAPPADAQEQLLQSSGDPRTSRRRRSFTCPSNCLSCERSRRKVPPRYTSTPRSLPTPSIGANAGHHRHLLTAPLRVQCTQCADGYAPSSPWGVRCDCAAGHAGANCTECADGEVAPQDRPGRRACTACPAGQVPNADSSKCVPDEPADPFLTPAVEEEEPECIPATTCPDPKAVCGVYTQCGVAIECGAGCGEGELCSADRTSCIPEDRRLRDCIPAACPADFQCGNFDDGCGSIITCGPEEFAGNCDDGEVCTADKTCEPVPQSCTAKTSCEYKVCGFEDDGCDGLVACGPNGDGTCANSGDSCLYDGLTCVPECVPKTTCDPELKCGTQDNGCGKEILCGECPEDFFCDEDPSDNSTSCQPIPQGAPACTPKAACDSNQACGVQEDGCGGIIDCEPCQDPKVCSDDGSACIDPDPECVPLTTCFNQTCGTQGDTCGGEIACGPACSTPRFPNCVPDNITTACAGQVCGIAGDGCGGIYDCGNCTTGYSCSSDGTTCFAPNTPCTPKTTCSSTVTCGTEPNGCGGVLSCGSCQTGFECVESSSGATCVQTQPACKAIGTTCSTSGNCCNPDNTFCDAGVCRVRPGGRCATGGRCGICWDNCGADTVAKTCSLYGVYNAKCSHSAVSGGGTQCGNTYVCCILTRPIEVFPDANGICRAP